MNEHLREGVDAKYQDVTNALITELWDNLNRRAKKLLSNWEKKMAELEATWTGGLM
jgi:hypothetical protein